MTQDQQRIAIAKVCGWKNADHPDAMRLKEGWTMPEKWCIDPKGVLRFNHDRPNYLGDLNACHEMEKLLTEEQRITYSDYTYDVACRYQEQTGKWRWISLTAAQRAEAFLRTLGLWQETQTQPQ
jgi:hypothetical protein